MWRLLTIILAAALSAQTSPASQTQNQDVRQRDLKLTFDVDAAPQGIPRGYAVVIGIAKYQKLDESAQLQFPESDAEAIYRVLVSREGGAFPSENVHLLKGSAATLQNIKHELEDWLPSVAQPEDRVVVYFAGHGLVTKGKGYLAAWDVDPSSPETTGYPMSTLGDVLANRVKARWKVLLTDACHSGKINSETTNESVDAGLRSLPSNFLTLTATTERERSYEDPNLSTGFGLFTYFLVQAFQGYGDNDPCDGRITADELIEYVRGNVRRYAKDRTVSQTPTPRGDYEPEMLLGVSPKCLVAADKPDVLVGTAIVESNMEDVDVYLNGKLIGKASPKKPLILPGLPSGLQKFEGVIDGYEPDRKEIMIVPGQEVTVTLRIRYARQIKKAALDLTSEGEKLLLTQRSTINPLNILPVNRSQDIDDIRKAQNLFTRALAEDPNYSKAAFHLGQTAQLLSDNEGALRAYRKAIEIDPSYVDARRQYSAVLIENGDPDEAIRQLVEGLRLDPKNDESYSLMARAYWDKGVWNQSVEMADRAIEIKASNDQAHLWKADALRQLAAIEKDSNRRTGLYERAREDYRTFLNLTNYSTTALDWVAFHFVGFGLGSRKHADRELSYNALRSSGFLGMCLSEEKLGNPLKAEEYCQRALKYSTNDPIAYFILGNVYRDLYNKTDRCDYLLAARSAYSKMVSINPDIAEARNARSYLEQIDSILVELRAKGCRQA